MFLDAFSGTLIRVWEYLTFWWYYPPALSNMRLKGPAREGDENALMVSHYMRMPRKRTYNDVSALSAYA